MTSDNSALTPKDVSDVAFRCEQSYHSITALHDLCNGAICGPTDDPMTLFVVLRDGLRGLARDMENCAEILDNDLGGLGYFVAHYGSI